MTPYHETFLPIFLAGCVIGAASSIAAAGLRGWIMPAFCLAFGILSVWAAMFLGADMGYRAWQSMPDPPDEAFSDASVMGALLVGWIPAGMFCLGLYGGTHLLKFLMRKTPQESGNLAQPSGTSADIGNPYQGPGGG